MRRSVCIAALLAVVATVVTTPPARAITNGVPDGDGHPYVAALIDDFRTPGYYERFCSGTLVAPTVVVTAAHCLVAVVDDQVWVSFDPEYVPGSSTLIHGTGYAAVDPAIFHGNAGAAAKYGNSRLGDDIAVVLLDEDPGISPAPLPAAGLLSSLELRGQVFTAVGYGTTRIDRTKGPNNFEPNRDPSVRNVTTEEFRSLQASAITMSGNPATGDGGTCYGDSGGPHFLGDSDLIVAITILGDAVCRSNDRSYRLDTPFARQFLAAYGVPVP